MDGGLGASLPQPGSPQAGVAAWLYLALLIPAQNLPSRLSSLPALPLGLLFSTLVSGKDKGYQCLEACVCSRRMSSGDAGPKGNVVSCHSSA